jgi:hypothetical protein
MKINNIHDYYWNKYNLEFNEKYDYSNSKIISSTDKFKVKCKLHEEFLVTPNNHFNKNSGCPKCKNVNKNFVKECEIIHNFKYDYTKTNYINNRTNIIITCKIHGDFEQLPFNHKNGFGCLNCANDLRRLNVKEFLENYGESIYDYRYVEEDYENMLSKVRIICPEHDVFEQEFYSHFVRKYNCKKYKKYKGEILIENYLKENNILFDKQKEFDDCKFINKLSFDFYLIIENICIEFNGIQHYKPISIFGGEEQFKKQLINDEIKRKYCLDNNIKLIIIKYDEDILDKLNNI